DIIDVFIVGNVDNQEIKKIFMDNFLVNTIKKQGESHIINHDKYRKRAKKVKEPYDSKQSHLLIGCKLDNLTDFERKYVSFVYSFILGGGPDSRLFITIREKHSLCYNISSSLKALSNLLIINAGIDKRNGEKAIKLIRKEILNISKGLIDEKELVNAKVNYENAINELVDIPSGIISHYTEKEYFSSDTFKERINNIKKIDKQMIVDFAKKVHIDTIYFLEGGNLDESDTI
ncbi:MAG: insulinase family protein, partial [Bacilli bacterium]|nr:insulinase family protein [Bacilli bacterium]